MKFIKIPKERIAVLIGSKGETRKMLESRAGVQIEVDTESNEVVIHDELPDSNPLDAMMVYDIVRAIGRGVAPDRAMRLFNEDSYFELIDMRELTGKNKSRQRQISARLIGSDGKTRRIIEEQTGCDMVVYGHTVALIGALESLQNARHAVEMLLRGSEHSAVYRFLERKRREGRSGAHDLWM